MHCSPETSFELIRRAQQELREQADRSRLLAAARRESSVDRRTPGFLTWAALRLRDTLTRP